LALDDQLVAARLAALDQYLRFLGETARLDLAVFTSDPRNYAAAERFLHLAIESVLDVGTHCIAALGLPRPARYADVVPTLAEAGIVTAETARELANIAGFRNLLVHDYAHVDRARVHAFLNARLDGSRQAGSTRPPLSLAECASV
jgi:uncharacterized protein YutE (UPF0331/DUF86 family)